MRADGPGGHAAHLRAGAAALGRALGTFVKTEAQAGGLSMMLGMVMALLGGCWYPIELFPPFVQTAAKVLPTTWAMHGMLDILLRGEGLAGVCCRRPCSWDLRPCFLSSGSGGSATSEARIR